MKSLGFSLLLVVLMPSWAAAASLQLLTDGSIEPDPVRFEVETFDSVAPGAVSGILASPLGMSFGERFVGQGQAIVTRPNGTFEAGFTTAGTPLALEAPPANDGLFGMAGGIFGCIAPCSSAAQQGEGMISMLFDADIETFGFDVLMSDGGSMRLAAFDRSGGLLGTLTIDPTGSTFFAFTVSGDAKIAGVSIWNYDTGGLGIDNVTLGPVPAIPLPGALPLLVSALAAGGLLSRRRASRAGCHGAASPSA